MQQKKNALPAIDNPPFLLAILIAARKSKERMIEELARDHLHRQGISVVFADEYPLASEGAEGARDDD
jgi:hypothetical protein